MKKIPLYKPNKTGAKVFQLTNRKTKYNDKDWVRYRFRFLHYNPKCYCCGGDSKHVDHIVSAVERPELFEDVKNHLPLCVSCHSTITAMFDAVKPQKLKEKLEWINLKRQQLKITISVKVLPEYKK